MIRISIFCIFFTLSYGLVYSQCDPSLVPVENKVLRYQTRGNRCEGFYDSKVSTPAQLFILAVTLGDFRFQKDANEVITLSVPSAEGQSVQVRAQGIPSNLYYRMDATLKGGETLKWDASSALLQRDASSRDYNIGVLAFQGEKTSRIYYPVASQTKLLDQSTKQNNLIFKFRATASLASVEYQVDQGASKKLSGSFTASFPIQLNLGIGLGKGKHTLIVKYREEGKDKINTESYTFNL